MKHFMSVITRGTRVFCMTPREEAVTHSSFVVRVAGKKVKTFAQETRNLPPSRCR